MFFLHHYSSPLWTIFILCTNINYISLLYEFTRASFVYKISANFSFRKYVCDTYRRQTKCRNYTPRTRFEIYRKVKCVRSTERTSRSLTIARASSAKRGAHNLDHPVAEKWGRLVNRRVLSGCTERADDQYGTTCCPSQRNRDTLSKAGESASWTALKAHFPHTYTRTHTGDRGFLRACEHTVCSAGVPSSTRLSVHFRGK